MKRVLRSSIMLLRTHILWAAVVLWAAPALAQMDRGEQRRSLGQVDRFGLVVDVEAPRTLAADPSLAISDLTFRLAGYIESAIGRAPAASPLESGHPYLYVHINALEAGEGLIPFAVNASFIQEVRVSRDGSRIMASTWDSGYVGLVSRDLIQAIADASESVVREFAEDLVLASDGG